MNYISIIIPCYNCAPFLDELAYRIDTTMNSLNISYEIILVNDESPLDDFVTIEELSRKYKSVKGIKLSRNFGQHYAIFAGLEHARGEWVVVMDGDLQDQPEEIPKLISKAKEGFDIVFAKREVRKDGVVKKLGSKFFYKTLAYLTETEQNSQIANYGIYNRKVIEAIINMDDSVRYFPTMVRWVGFKQGEIFVTHAKRQQGRSSYSFKSLFQLGLNVILSFSDKPLRLTVKLGLLISFFSFMGAIFYFIKYVTGKIEVVGYASLIISLWLLSGVIITVLGMMGLYIGKIFDQVKDRPKYIIDEKIKFDD